MPIAGVGKLYLSRVKMGHFCKSAAVAEPLLYGLPRRFIGETLRKKTVRVLIIGLLVQYERVGTASSITLQDAVVGLSSFL
jgi:hypothetical protein